MVRADLQVKGIMVPKSERNWCFMPNPFYYGGHITNPYQFIGRKAELRRIFAALEIAHTGQMQSLSIIGPRRIGKSSLLYYLIQAYARYLLSPASYRIAYISLQDADCKTQY